MGLLVPFDLDFVCTRPFRLCEVPLSAKFCGTKTEGFGEDLLLLWFSSGECGDEVRLSSVLWDEGDLFPSTDLDREVERETEVPPTSLVRLGLRPRGTGLDVLVRRSIRFIFDCTTEACWKNGFGASRLCARASAAASAFAVTLCRSVNLPPPGVLGLLSLPFSPSLFLSSQSRTLLFWLE